MLMPSIARRISPTCRAPHLRKIGEDGKRETDSGNKVRKSFVWSKARKGLKTVTADGKVWSKEKKRQQEKRIAKYVYLQRIM